MTGASLLRSERGTIRPRMAYFVTGALGCIGAWIVKQLNERGDRVVMFDATTDRHRLRAVLEDDESAEAVPLVQGDLTDTEGVRRALEESGATRVIHLAGVQVPTCRANPVLGATVNVVGTLNVFEAVRALGLERVVYASSAAVFGESEDDSPVEEAEAGRPRTHYGWFKVANEGNAAIYAQDHGVDSIGLRPLTVYGVARDFGITSDTSEAIRHAMLGRPFQIRFGGSTDFLHVADCAAAFIGCVDAPLRGAHVFNLHGESVPVEMFVTEVERRLPEAQRGLIRVDGPPIPMAATLSDRALRAAVPGLPWTSVRDGVTQTVAHFGRLIDKGWWKE